jgi:hypothetical protein
VAPRVGLVPLALLVGCAEPYDALDPDVVNDLARTQGNALGYAYSGDYRVEFDETECGDCNVVGVQFLGLMPCLEDPQAVDFGPLTTLVRVIHSDGVLRMHEMQVAGTGPVDADGSFAVGRVASLDAGLGEGTAVMRVDGRFDGDGAFEATMQQHIVGSFSDESYDCRRTFELTATRP